MDDTQVQVAQQPVVSTAAITALNPVQPARSLRKTGIARVLSKGLQRLASLQLTVTLFALAIFLVFCGTLAQVDSGIWTVVGQYFRSFYVWIPLQIFCSREIIEFQKPGEPSRIGFPFPGGWLLGSLLLLNLVAAHAVRFKATWKRSGIIILHAGLIVIMVSELVTGLYAVEGSMLIYEGQSANYVYHPREPELAVMPAGTEEFTDVVVIPTALLQKKDAVIKNDLLPFDVEVIEYMVNSRLGTLRGPEFHSLLLPKMAPVPTGVSNRATAGFGAIDYVAVKLKETGGVVNDEEDLPAAYVRFRQKGTGQDLGTYLVSLALHNEPQYVTVDGKKFDVRLRPKRTYRDYQVFLVEFSHNYYVGTDNPKNYSSRIRLTDPTRNVERDALISMNDPLRYSGETFYQQSFQVFTGKKATILQVVRNPGWLMPYISCVMVAIGMLIHFGMHLESFLRRRAAK